MAVLLVVIGGSLGAATREALTLALPAPGIPWTTFGINVAGAFALGLLLESLLRSDIGPHGSSRLRALAGTGFLGGFTTYSTLTLGTVQLLGTGQLWPGLLYASSSAVVGVLAAGAGIVLAGARRSPAVRGGAR